MSIKSCQALFKKTFIIFVIKALVISVGGSKGALPEAWRNTLVTVCKRGYKIFIGSSAGSLLVPLQERKYSESNYTTGVILITDRNDNDQINPLTLQVALFKITFYESPIFYNDASACGFIS